MTLAIYKFNYKFYGSTYFLCFSLSEETTKQIDMWSLPLDRTVLEEQLQTGSFRGQFPIEDDTKDVLIKLKEQGIIQPYYGMINARVCIYTLQVSPTNCKLDITHTVMEKSMSTEVSVSIYRHNFLGILNNRLRGFMIKKQEYQKLSNWKCWNPREEFTFRYTYTFSPTTVGVGIKVFDNQTSETIDITDYDDW